MSDVKRKVVLYTDGSCRGNPGPAGFGIYGFIYSNSDKPKNHKHPYRGTLYFTDTGIDKIRSERPIFVESIIEIIGSIGGSMSTNNEAELKALSAGLFKATEIDNLEEVAIYTDSNYVVQAFNGSLNTWLNNNWKRVDGKDVSHIPEWLKIVQYRNTLEEKGCSVKLNWVKGHTDVKDPNYSYCNNMADVYSVIGSNYSRINTPTDDIILLNQVITYADYKKSYEDKDFLLHFKDLYFTSDGIDDRDYCFISVSDDPLLFGKRNNSSIFVTTVGYVPEYIKQIKSFYRQLERNYVTTCCIKISKLSDRDICRLVDYIDIRYMLIPIMSNPNAYSLVGDKYQFLFENTLNFPFIMNAAEMFNKTIDVNSEINSKESSLLKFDITETFVNKEERKLKLSNKDNYIDFTDLVKDFIEFKQKLIIKVSYDVPSYLALKSIEEEINSVYLIIEANENNNYCTVYVSIITNLRTIYSTNIGNKYLRKTK